MSRADDRIPVPGNGHHPALPADAPPGATTPASVDPATPATPPASPTPTPADITLAFTPGQLAVGFGILASIILLVLGRRRRNR